METETNLSRQRVFQGIITGSRWTNFNSV